MSQKNTFLKIYGFPKKIPKFAWGKKMQLYSTQKLCLGEVLLDPEESQHIIRVLRHRAGDCLRLTDGNGLFADSVIIEPDPRGCLLSVEKIHEAPLPFPMRLVMGVAITRNSERFEWFAEKATEIGVSEIHPIICERAERKKINTERLARIVKSAAKQSMHYHFPKVGEPAKFEDFVNAFSNEPLFIAVCNHSETKALALSYAPGANAVILIGPEGDFTDKELSLATKVGAKPVTLGEFRLRTETAALAACHTIHIMNESKR